MNILRERSDRGRDDGLHTRGIAQFADGLRVQDSVLGEAMLFERGFELGAINDLETLCGGGEIAGSFLGEEAAQSVTSSSRSVKSATATVFFPDFEMASASCAASCLS